MAVPAMLEHGRDARGTKSRRGAENPGIRNVATTEKSLLYSYRSATSGSTLVARRAGM
jgi:hypothetical protein